MRITDQDTLERLASVWATKGWPYQERNGYFYLYDEDEQRVLVDANLVFSVKPSRVHHTPPAPRVRGYATRAVRTGSGFG